MKQGLSKFHDCPEELDIREILGSNFYATVCQTTSDLSKDPATVKKDNFSFTAMASRSAARWDHTKCWISSIRLYEHFAYSVLTDPLLLRWEASRKDQCLLACRCKLGACVWEQLFFSWRKRRLWLSLDCGESFSVALHGIRIGHDSTQCGNRENVQVINVA